MEFRIVFTPVYFNSRGEAEDWIKRNCKDSIRDDSDGSFTFGDTTNSSEVKVQRSRMIKKWE